MMGRLGQKKPRVGAFAQRPPQPARFSPRQLLIVALSCLILVAALTREPEPDPIVAEDIDSSPIASKEMKAAFYFQTVDLEATEEARNAAEQQVPDYYNVHRIDGQVAGLKERFGKLQSHGPAVEQAIRDALRGSTSAESTEEVVTEAVMRYAATLKADPEWQTVPDAGVLALWLTPDLASVPERTFAPVPEGQAAGPRPVTGLAAGGAGTFVFTYGDLLEDLALEGLRFVLTQGVRMGAIPPGERSRKIVILRDTPLEGQPVHSELTLAEVPDPEQAAEILSVRLRDTAKRAAKETETPEEWAKLHQAALAMARPAIIDTIRYDNVYTVGARERERESVPPVMKDIEAGEIIQDRGKRWTKQSRSDAKTYLSYLENEDRPVRRVLSAAVAHAVLVLLVLACLYRSLGLSSFDSADKTATRLNLALLLLCATLILGRVSSYFEPTGFVLPMAATGIFYAILVNVRLAAMLSFLTAVLVSAQYGYDWRLLVVGSAMSLAGVFSITKVRRRSDMATAAIVATIAGLLAAAAVSLAMDSLLSEASLRRLVFVGLNGVICLFAVPGLLSPLERLFGITTDIQLLEYSDLNNEVLSRMAMEVPATYAHSLMLGQLAEAAADAIGANGLLARVCAYYHDIGKMKRPEYFSENQAGYNIHDDLSPRLSARAIAAHVLQGAEMAREYHLPKPIVDGILEHHGTSLISFFYQQALAQQKHGDVRQEDFRYPGPKPQSPETAILMICDGAESGVRSIKNPTEERVREFVDKIIASRAESRQFDDCNLTLKQLNTIAEVVSQRVVTNLHTRIAYPDAKPQKKAANVVPISGGSE